MIAFIPFSEGVGRTCQPMNETNSISPATRAVSPENKSVFITIYREDREWINNTKGKLNREQRLHELITRVKELGL